MVEKTVNTEELAQVARSDTPLGFRIFYVLVHNKPMPRHAEAWVEQINRALSVLIEAFRGSTKTTVVNTYLAYRIGLEPHKANLLIQVGDQIAQDNAALIADIIENNSGFKLCFPNVIPDKERGWGAMGYEVKRTDIEYADWRRMNSDRKDPTLIGLGYTSGAIIGKHPDGVLVMDDVDNEENTSSPRERARTDKILTGTIFETIVPGKTKTVVIGTPWTMNDTISYIKATGLFDCTRTPVYAAPGVPTWPDKFPEEEIERHRKLAGAVEFARMFLLDLEAARGIHLKHEWLHYYPAVTREPFEHRGHDHRGRMTDLMATGRMMQQLGIEALDPEHDRAMICGSPQMLADFRALLDGRGFTAAPRIGTPGQYVFERAFVEK